jgi:hypothetical protein
LAPGEYQFVLEVVGDEGAIRKVSKQVLVTNEFLFGQDIVVQEGTGDQTSRAAADMPKITIINDNFRAIDQSPTVSSAIATGAAAVATSSAGSAIATAYGPEFNVTHIPVDDCPAGTSASFIQLASYSDLTNARKKLAEYSIDNSFIDFYDGESISGMRQYRIVAGPFNRVTEDLTTLVNRYEDITGAKTWTQYRACDDLRRHP